MTRACGARVQRFDHFCPWVGNSIGKKNHHIFILFIVLFVGPILTGYVIAFQRLQQARLFHPRPRHAHAHSLADSALNYDILVIIAWMVLNVPLLCTLVGLAVAQIGQVRAPCLDLPAWLCEHCTQGRGARGGV